MNPSAIFLLCSVCLVAGLVLGILGTVRSIHADMDAHRLDHLEEFNLCLHTAGDRWAIMRRDADGIVKMTGQSHETLRGAIDASLGMANV